MRLLPRRLAWVFFVLGGCIDAPTGPAPLPVPMSGSPSVSGCDPMTAVIPCPDEESGANSTYWAFFAPRGDQVYEAPGDPSPGAPGIWLGAHISPAACFNDQNASITDSDHDWLDDNCELELARGFAPRWSMGEQDHCPDGEPVWAAKYFSIYGIVRLAYMAAYYDDCGSPTHAGDSEFVMVQVGFNYGTRHWEFHTMWLSAHYGAGAWDRSAWVSPTDANFTRRHLGHPYVAVSANKHANYKSEQTCNKTTANQSGNGEWCYGSMLTPFRFPIDPSRNAGSRFTDLIGCVPSTKRFAGNGRTECFYRQWYNSHPNFAGWHTGAEGVTPYNAILRSDKFESYNGYWGPGPDPYSPPPPDPPPDPPPGGCEDPTQVYC